MSEVDVVALLRRLSEDGHGKRDGDTRRTLTSYQRDALRELADEMDLDDAIVPRLPRQIDPKGRLVFKCDDRRGYEFVVVRANDGDFHLGVRPNQDDIDRECGDGTYLDVIAPRTDWSASVRIRAGMIGGGDHGDLYMALARIWNKAERATSQTESKS